MSRAAYAKAAGLVACVGLQVLVAGCAVGPNFTRPTPPQTSGYTREPLPGSLGEGGDQAFVQAADIPGQWWTVFQSPKLNALITEALKNSPNLEAAKAALRAAHETYYAQQGALLPSVDAGYDYQRQQASGTPAPVLSSNANPFSLHTAQLSIAYTPDVFGGIRRQTESVAAQAEAQRFETEAAYLTLTSNLVAAAIQEAALRDQIVAADRVIDLNRGILDLTRRQKAVGQASGVDVAAQEAALAQAEQALPPLQKSLAQTLDLIAALLGRLPSDTPQDGISLADLTLPHDLPVSLPSRLVEQRPDIRVAEANLHSASALVGVAIANRLPSFTLSATAGGASTNIASLFSQGNGFWGLGLAAAQPIFHGGSLLHQQRAAEASLAEARAQYRGAVISAFQNVADTLQALQSDALALQAADHAERSAQASLDIARKQFEVGDTSAITVMNAEQAYQQALITRAQAQSNRYADTAALFQALGGGWWNRKDA